MSVPGQQGRRLPSRAPDRAPSSGPNTALTYIYRDAGNNKSAERTVVFGGAVPDAEGTLRAALDSGEFFNARQIGLSELWGSSFDAELDHSWHEFVQIEVTGAAPNDPAGRHIEDFLAEVEAIGPLGWEVDPDRA